jgi:hypothetical protein
MRPAAGVLLLDNMPYFLEKFIKGVNGVSSASPYMEVLAK